MKISQKAQECHLSPMRKFHPYAVEAVNRGKTIYHLNIGQPDIETPPAYYEAIRTFENPVLEYAETNLNLEDNMQIRNLWKRFNAIQHKRRRAYVKTLQ